MLVLCSHYLTWIYSNHFLDFELNSPTVILSILGLTQVFIGGLRDDANRYDIEDVFNKYGNVRDVWVARKPPGFAFVEMEDPRDAKDAARGLDGTRICGAR